MKKKGLLIPLLSLLAMTAPLASCGKNNNSESSTIIEEEVTFTIANETELTAAWQVGEKGRTVELTTDPEINVLSEVSKGNLSLKTSNAAIVSLSGGLGISAAGAGTATITVVYKTKDVASVDITVTAKESNKVKYGTTHEGTAEDPFDNEDAVKVGKTLTKDESTIDEFYIRGEVEAFYHCVGERSDGVTSWFFKAANGGERFEAYKIKTEDDKALTDADVFPGAIVTIKGKITTYNTQVETPSGVLVKTEGTAPAVQTINSTVAEALTIGKALQNGDSTYYHYAITAYVISGSAGNAYLADSKEETDTKNQFFLTLTYATSLTDEVKGKVLPGAKIKVTLRIKNYNGTIENSAVYGLDILEEGREIQTIESNVDTALEAAKDIAVTYGTTVYSEAKYAVTGYVVKTGTWSDQHNNWDVYIADNEGETDTSKMLQLFRDTHKDLTVGDKVKVTDFLAVYQKDADSTAKYQFKQGAEVTVLQKASTGGETGGETENEVSITSSKLGLTNSYKDNTTGVDVNGLSIGYTQVADYGDGIQMRYKNNIQSAFYNLVASSKAITKITLNLNASKFTQYAAPAIEVTFGTSLVKDETTPTQTITPVLGTNSYNVDAPAGSTYFKIAKSAASYTLYFESVVITFAE